MKSILTQAQQRVIESIIDKVFAGSVVWRPCTAMNYISCKEIYKQQNHKLLSAMQKAAPFICGLATLDINSFPIRTMEISSHFL